MNTTTEDLRTAAQVVLDHARETYPHFESPRGKADLLSLELALAAAVQPALKQSEIEALAFGAEALDFMHNDRREHFDGYPEDFDNEEPDWSAYETSAATLRQLAMGEGNLRKEGGKMTALEIVATWRSEWSTADELAPVVVAHLVKLIEARQ